MGTWQSSMTNFKYVSKEWKQNCEEERLLGVSFTGLRDHKILGSVNDKAKKWEKGLELFMSKNRWTGSNGKNGADYESYQFKMNMLNGEIENIDPLEVAVPLKGSDPSNGYEAASPDDFDIM